MLKQPNNHFENKKLIQPLTSFIYLPMLIATLQLARTSSSGSHQLVEGYIF